jgi:hypothetical protein
MQWRTIANNCPECGKHLDATSNLNNTGKPKTDDITLCLYCGAFLLFNADLTVRKMSTEEFEEIRKSALWPELEKVSKSLTKFRKHQM